MTTHLRLLLICCLLLTPCLIGWAQDGGIKPPLPTPQSTSDKDKESKVDSVDGFDIDYQTDPHDNGIWLTIDSDDGGIDIRLSTLYKILDKAEKKFKIKPTARPKTTPQPQPPASKPESDKGSSENPNKNRHPR